MTKTIASLVRGLRGARDIKAHYRAIDEFVVRGEFQKAVDLARSVEAQPNIGVEPWALEAVFDRVVRALALRDATDSASAAIHLALSSRKQSTQRARSRQVVSRELASLLANGQTKRTLLAALEQLESQSEFEEVLVCWVQELVVRGNDLSGERGVARFWRRLQGSLQPLAALPLRLEPIETELKDWLPNEQLNGSSCGLPYGPSESPHVDAPASFELVAFEEIPAMAATAAVVSNWQEESGGRFEARRFRFDRAIRPHAVNAAFMRMLPLLCLEGAAVGQVVLRQVPAERALGVLFAASANGGAYNRGRRAAHGRLELWRSVAALTGSDSTEVGGIAENAAEWSWYSFDARSGWFEQVAWDLGLATLSPDGMEVSVLAATDTD